GRVWVFDNTAKKFNRCIRLLQLDTISPLQHSFICEQLAISLAGFCKTECLPIVVLCSFQIAQPIMIGSLPNRECPGFIVIILIFVLTESSIEQMKAIRCTLMIKQPVGFR